MDPSIIDDQTKIHGRRSATTKGSPNKATVSSILLISLAYFYAAMTSISMDIALLGPIKTSAKHIGTSANATTGRLSRVKRQPFRRLSYTTTVKEAPGSRRA